MTKAPAKKLFSIERKALARQAAGEEQNLITSPAGAGDGSADLLEELASLRTEIQSLQSDIAEIKAAVTGGDGDGQADYSMMQEVRIEIAQMVRSIGRAKQEIAAIKHPLSENDQMDTASRQLESIVETTEAATNDIMSATDAVEEQLEKIRAMTTQNPEVGEVVDEAISQLTAIIEACGFQDLTGQRVTQVVKTLRFIESRILAMIDIWGLDAFQDLPAAEQEEAEDPRCRTAGWPGTGQSGPEPVRHRRPVRLIGHAGPVNRPVWWRWEHFCAGNLMRA